MKERGKSIDQVANDLDEVKSKIDETHKVTVEGWTPQEVIKARVKVDNSKPE